MLLFGFDLAQQRHRGDTFCGACLSRWCPQNVPAKRYINIISRIRQRQPDVKLTSTSPSNWNTVRAPSEGSGVKYTFLRARTFSSTPSDSATSHVLGGLWTLQVLRPDLCSFHYLHAVSARPTGDRALSLVQQWCSNLIVIELKRNIAYGFAWVRLKWISGKEYLGRLD